MPDRLAFRGVFKGFADDGTVYTVDVFELMLDDQRESTGSFAYRTTDGKTVRRLGSGTYQIVESGQLVRRLSDGSSG
jgi:hypothetical protein